LSAALRTPSEAAAWLQARITGTLRADSRDVQPGDGFLAWPGAAVDARQHVPSALAAGAAACLVEQDGAERYGFADARVATYDELKAAAAPVAAAYFGAPSEQLAVLAVTGTNGKTSTAWWLAQSLSLLGRRCGLVGTLGIGEPGAMVFNGLTTPDPVRFQQQLRRMVDEGYAACALEASSIGLAESRLDETRIHTAIFTNFTQDHLDYHVDMDSYWAAKERLFAWSGLRAAVINLDDAKGSELAALAARPGVVDVWTYSCAGAAGARLSADNILFTETGLRFDVCEASARCAVSAHVVGQFNVSNLLGVIAALRSVGVSLQDAGRVCAQLSPVPGRMDMLAVTGAPLVVIDYAHTPDALAKALEALRPAVASRKGVLWCVFGCGGDRDPTKRPVMAAVAEAGADHVVVTSDNPRSEPPLAIIDSILRGFKQPAAVRVQADRALAIAQTLAAATAADVVLVAGKGHEDYQDVGGIKHPFSDRSHAERALAARQGVCA
jgi:UDP-N-acetylmuramyl-tripeptide synthetase